MVEDSTRHKWIKKGDVTIWQGCLPWRCIHCLWIIYCLCHGPIVITKSLTTIRRLFQCRNDTHKVPLVWPTAKHEHKALPVSITKTCLFKYTENFTTKKDENLQIKIYDYFHICAQNIDCGYSLEPPRRGGSKEYPQSMFLSTNKKKIMYTPVNPSFTI